VKMNDNFTAIENAVNTLIPAGTIVAYFGTIAPEGWLVASGVTIDKSVNTDYTALVDHLRALNTDQGNDADNPADTNQAVLPDLRGQFLRGQDKEAGVNPDCGDDLIGQVQNDAYASHIHGAANTCAPGSGDPSISNLCIDGSPAIVTGAANYANTGATGDSETRPKNMTVLYIIKY